MSFSVFKFAVEEGDVEDFRKYFDKFAHAKFGNHQFDVLQYAVYNMQTDIVEIILDSGKYDINYQNGYGKTALIIAMDEFNDESEWNAEAIFKYNPDVDVDIADNNGRNAVLAGMMSGIGQRYIMLAAEKTKNLEQFDTEMKETVVDACLRNKDMYRLHAQILADYIRRGANITEEHIYKMMGYTKSRKLSSVWKAVDDREELYDTVIKIAAEKGYDEFMPEAAKDLFVF